jgi:nicotinamidase-related amidase
VTQYGDIDEFYKHAGLGARVGFGRSPAVLVVDMQVAFNDPSYRLGAEQTSAVEAIARLLPHARAKGVPIFFARTGYRADGSDGGIYIEKIPTLSEVTRGTPGYEFIPELLPNEQDIVIEKRFPSAFFQTNLSTLLVARRIDTIILVGASTSGCIRAAAIDGMSHGYRMIFPRECIADRAQRPHEANLLDMDAKYGDVMPAEDVIAYLDDLEEVSAMEEQFAARS